MTFADEQKRRADAGRLTEQQMIRVGRKDNFLGASPPFAAATPVRIL